MNTLFIVLQATGAGQGLLGLWPMLLIIVVMWFFMIRPQKKREKEAAAMRHALEVGDEIITIGGIVGTVVSLRDDTIVIETGSDRSKIRILRSSVQANNTASERNAASAPAKKK